MDLIIEIVAVGGVVAMAGFIVFFVWSMLVYPSAWWWK